jgi:hypothetical protein
LTSMVTLSVSIWAMMSSSLTGSPALKHKVEVWGQPVRMASMTSLYLLSLTKRQ